MAKSFKENNLRIVGMKEKQSMVGCCCFGGVYIYSNFVKFQVNYLASIIPPAAMLGGGIIGGLTVIADLLGKN